MSWTERQRAMLAEMGLRVWAPVPAVPEPTAAAAVGAAAVEPSASPLAAPPPAHEPAAPAPARMPRPSLRPAAAAASAPSAPTLPPPAARPLGVETLGWAELQQSVAACTACGLCKTRRQAVFGVGSGQARVMVIGEAPGEQEDQQGEPFVGKSGQLLDRMLQTIGLSRAPAEGMQQVFITNVLKCRPPMNRNPTPEEVVQCEPFLRRQVELVSPGLILAFGRFAIESVLKTQEAVGRLRGRVHDYAGVPVVVSYHPAYLLRQPLEKAKAWEDLCLAREVLQSRP